MKKYKIYETKLILLAIMLLVYILPTFSQTCTDMMKYWYYRNRLKYFVVPGEKIGESQIICTRNKYRNQDVDYGQHGKHDGLYIGVLATEHYLLEKNGQYDDAANTLTELYYSLNAVKTYWDEQAEPFWEDENGDPYNASYNGFFIRGNVPCNFFNPDDTNSITISGEKYFDLT